MVKRATAAVSRVLAPLGQLQAAGPDLDLEAAGTRFRFDVRWAGEGYPEDVRRVVSTLPGPTGQPGARGPVTVVAARRFSTGAQRMLREHGLSWADESGAAHIVAAPGLLIDRDRGPRLASARSTTGWTWSPSASALAEVVLAAATARAGGPLTAMTLPAATTLARRAQVSISSVNTTLRGWQTQGWLAKSGGQRGPTARRLLVEPSGLLDSWTTWTTSQPLRELAVQADFSDALAWCQAQLPKVMPRSESWCLGGLVATQMLSGQSGAASRVLCHVVEDVFEMLGDALTRGGTAAPPTDGPRLVLRAAARATIAVAGPRPLPLASAPRIYADLMRQPGNGNGAAGSFREVRLGL